MRKMKLIEILVLIFMMALCLWFLYCSIDALINIYIKKPNRFNRVLSFYSTPTFLGCIYLLSGLCYLFQRFKISTFILFFGSGIMFFRMAHWGVSNHFPFNGFDWDIEYKESLGLLFSLINQAHGLFFLVTFLFFIVLGVVPAIRQHRNQLKTN